jgi:hypothetical protein
VKVVVPACLVGVLGQAVDHDFLEHWDVVYIDDSDEQGMVSVQANLDSTVDL